MAVEKENIEIIKLLLTNDQLDINFLNIFNTFIDKIQNHAIQYNSKLDHSMQFKIISFNEIQNHIIQ